MIRLIQVLIFGLTIYTTQSFALEQYAVVIGDNVRLREVASLKGKYETVLFNNMVVKVLEKSQDTAEIEGQKYAWIKVKSEDREGWCLEKFLRLTDKEEKLDTYAASGDMSWFHKRFGYSTEYESQKLTAKNFSVQEYREFLAVVLKEKTSIDDDSYGGGYSTLAGSILHDTIYSHLKANPNDPTYQYLKTKLYAPETIKDLALKDQCWIFDIVPQELATQDLVLSVVDELSKREYRYAQYCLFQIPDRLTNDRAFMSKVVQKSGQYAAIAGPELWKDKEFVLSVVKLQGMALKRASDTLKNDKEVVLAAVRSDRDSIQFASERLKLDADVIKVLVSPK